MGVWGDIIVESGIRFILHYKAPFDSSQKLDVIDTLVVLDQDKSIMPLDVANLKEKYIGRTLSEIQG